MCENPTEVDYKKKKKNKKKKKKINDYITIFEMGKI